MIISSTTHILLLCYRNNHSSTFLYLIKVIDAYIAAGFVQKRIYEERREGKQKVIHTRFVNIPPFPEFIRTRVPTCEDLGKLIEFKGTVIVLFVNVSELV